MKTEIKILIAFLLNLIFSAVEFVGGMLTGSVAILSDSVHDFGDSISIGISFFLEKLSKKAPDQKYTYGYQRYSVLGSVITTVILLCGSVAVIYSSIVRIIHPVAINYNGMILLAILGAVINFFAAYFTHGKGSLNQKAVNLHMLEDVLGWIVVLIGAVVMKFTDIAVIDPILSVAVAVFIFFNALRNLKTVIDLFLEKTPSDVDISEINAHLTEIEGVIDIHHFHIRSIDGFNKYATLHVVTDRDHSVVKSEIKKELSEHGISHVTVETERSNEVCEDKQCSPVFDDDAHGHHHHHGHHHGHH